MDVPRYIMASQNHHHFSLTLLPRQERFAAAMLQHAKLLPILMPTAMLK